MASPIVVRAETPMVLCSILPQQPDHIKWAFTTIPPPRFEVVTRLEYLKNKTQVKKIGVLHDPSPYAVLQKNIAEKTAAEHGKTMDRNDWRIVIHVHLAETREQAQAEARDKAGHYQRDYFETTLGHERSVDGPIDTILDTMVGRGLWCVGTPDDLVAMIHRLDERSGGFGGLMIQATEWAGREEVFRSHELIARYVMPQFQGSLRGLQASQAASQKNSAAIRAMQVEAVEQAKREYAAKAAN